MNSTNHIDQLARNPGTELDLDWILAVQANTSAIERRCKSLPGRRSIKKSNQAAWLLKAITCIDLTTLSGDDTEHRVRRLCQKAKFPIRADLLENLELEPGTITTGAICVYHDMVTAAVSALEGSGIPVAAVSTGFPAGIDNSIRLKIESASMYERQYVFHLTSNNKPNNEQHYLVCVRLSLSIIRLRLC